MAAQPPELRRDIERTRARLDGIIEELSLRIESALASTKRHLDPRHLASQHPAVLLAAVSLVAAISAVALRRVSFAPLRRRPLTLKLVGRRGPVAELTFYKASG